MISAVIQNNTLSKPLTNSQTLLRKNHHAQNSTAGKVTTTLQPLYYYLAVFPRLPPPHTSLTIQNYNRSVTPLQPLYYYLAEFPEIKPISSSLNKSGNDFTIQLSI
jgi:hypothetical protein